MMCLACEQQGLWLAYLKRRGLITPDGYLVEQPPFLADAAESQSAQPTGKDQAAGSIGDPNKASDDASKAG